MLFYCSIAQITFHAWGVGSGFADWQAMFLLSAAALCLINALIHPGIFWIRMFSLFVSLAVLARTTATFYAVTCAPMIGIYLIEQYKRERSIKQPGITILNILVVIMPAANRTWSTFKNVSVLWLCKCLESTPAFWGFCI